MAMVLGIDPSLNSTGLALLNYRDGGLVATRAIRPNKVIGFDRLSYNRAILQDFLKPAEPYIGFAVIEDYAYYSVGRGKLQIAEWVGIIKMYIYDNFGDCVYSVPSTTLKKFICGNARVQDRVIGLEAYKRFGWEFETEDEVDACALAEFGRRVSHYCYGLRSWEEGLIEAQKSAILNYAENNRILLRE